MKKILLVNWNKIEENLGGQESYFSELSKILNAKIISYVKAENTLRYNLFMDYAPIYQGYIIDRYLKWYEKLFKTDLIIKNAGVGFESLKTPQIIIFQDPFYSIQKFLKDREIFLAKSWKHHAYMDLQRKSAKQGKTIAVSNFMAEDMKNNDIRCDKIIEEGIDIERFKPVEDKEKLKIAHNLLLDKKIGIVVTKFIAQKGWNILARLINKFPDIHWIVILTEKIGSKPKLKNVTLIEQVAPEAIPRFYNCADFFINTSPVESFGLSACEAAACNLPIIIYKTGWAWDWWDKRLGLRVDDWTYDAFEEAVKKIRDSDLSKFSPRKALIERGFTKERMAKEWSDYVEKLLKK